MKDIKKGYSLIEVLVVLAIIAIILAISPISLRGIIKEYQFKQDVLELKGDILYIRSQSIATGNTYKMNFNMSSNSYDVIETGTRIRRIKQKTFHNDTKIISNNFPSNSLYFSSTGAPNQGGTIIIGNNLGYRSSIRVRPATGKIKIEYEK